MITRDDLLKAGFRIEIGHSEDTLCFYRGKCKIILMPDEKWAYGYIDTNKHTKVIKLETIQQVNDYFTKWIIDTIAKKDRSIKWLKARNKKLIQQLEKTWSLNKLKEQSTI